MDAKKFSNTWANLLISSFLQEASFLWWGISFLPNTTHSCFFFSHKKYAAISPCHLFILWTRNFFLAQKVIAQMYPACGSNCNFWTKKGKILHNFWHIRVSTLFKMVTHFLPTPIEGEAGTIVWPYNAKFQKWWCNIYLIPLYPSGSLQRDPHIAWRYQVTQAEMAYRQKN